MYAEYEWGCLDVCGLLVLASLLRTSCPLPLFIVIVLICSGCWALCYSIRLDTFVHLCADLQGLVLRLLTYLGLKYCNQRSKHNPVARAFTRMWMRVRFYSKLQWWSMPSTPRSASALPVQELSDALEHQPQKDLPAKSDIATPLLAQAVPF